MAFERVISLISKAPEARGNIQIELVIPWLKRNCEAFRDLNRDVVKDILKNCGYQRVVRDDVILRQGETGLCMFIMLSGRASVYIDNFLVEDDFENQGDVREPLVKGIESLDRSLFGKFIIQFEAGKRFGEMALMTETATRNASIISDEITDLLIIDRELFNRALKTNEEEEHRDLKTFISKSFLFGRWSPQLKRMVELSLHKETYPFNNVIVKQGQPVRGLFFINRGEIRLEVDPALHRYQYPHIYRTDSTAKTEVPNRKGVSLGCVQDHIRIRRKCGYKAAEQLQMKKTQNVCCLQENAVFCDIEAILGLRTNLFSAVSTTYTEVYVLKTKNIERLISRKSQRAAEKLKVIVWSKIRRRIQAQNIPIMSLLAQKLESMMPVKPPLPAKQNIAYWRKKQQDREREIAKRRLQQAKPKHSPHKAYDVRNISASSNNGRFQRSVRLLMNLNLAIGVTDRPRSSSSQTAKPRNNHVRPKTAPACDRSAPSNASPRPKSCEQKIAGFRPSRPESRSSVRTVTSSKLHSASPEATMEMLRSRLKELQALRTNHRMDLSKTSNKESPQRVKADKQIQADYETSDAALDKLEYRISSFGQKVCANETTTSVNPALKLRRFQLKDSSKPPSPGGCVIVKTSICHRPVSTPDVNSSVKHKHVRRFVLSR